MKTCEKCGKEFADEIFECPDCSTIITATVEKSQKKLNKKTIPIIIVAIIAVAIAFCAVIGVTISKNQEYAQEITQMLEGKTFERVSADIESAFMAETFKFVDGQKIYDNWYYSAYNDEPWEHSQSISEYEVEVPLLGNPTVDGYEIIIENNQIVCLSANMGDMIPVEIPAISKKAVDIFSGLGWEWNGTTVSLGTLIPEIFKDYTIYVDPCVDEEYCFSIEVSGVYYPNKLNMSYYTEEGSFSCKVNIKTEEATELNMGSEMSTAFNMQVAYEHLF